MTIFVTLRFGEQVLEAVLDDEALAAIAASLPAKTAPEEESPFFSIAEAAAFLRCSRQHVYDLRSSRRLTPFRDGTRALVSRAELEQLITSGRGRQ